MITFLIIKNTPLDAEMDENFGEIAGFWKLLQLHIHVSHVTHIVSAFQYWKLAESCCHVRPEIEIISVLSMFEKYLEKYHICET